MKTFYINYDCRIAGEVKSCAIVLGFKNTSHFGWAHDFDLVVASQFLLELHGSLPIITGWREIPRDQASRYIAWSKSLLEGSGTKTPTLTVIDGGKEP